MITMFGWLYCEVSMSRPDETKTPSHVAKGGVRILNRPNLVANGDALPDLLAETAAEEDRNRAKPSGADPSLGTDSNG